MDYEQNNILERNNDMIFKSSEMDLNIKNALGYLTFKALDDIPFIRHGFSTRMGGVSSGEFTSLNMSFGRGDPDENVTENYKRLCEAVGVSFESLTASSQDHNTFVRKVTKADRGVGIYRPKDMMSVDGLITNEPGVTLVTYFADCTPLMFIDKRTHAIGSSHAGWRGTVGCIGEKTVNKMKEEFGTDPCDLIVTIGPAIGKCCYEVDDPVASKVEALGLDTSKLLFPKGGGKYMLDLLETNKQIIMRAGVPEENIIKSDVCTRCNHDLIWSHRATGGKRGGMCGVLSIEN